MSFSTTHAWLEEKRHTHRHRHVCSRKEGVWLWCVKVDPTPRLYRHTMPHCHPSPGGNAKSQFVLKACQGAKEKGKTDSRNRRGGKSENESFLFQREAW